jgi:hypothetical protein
MEVTSRGDKIHATKKDGTSRDPYLISLIRLPPARQAIRPCDSERLCTFVLLESEAGPAGRLWLGLIGLFSRA